MRHKLASLGNKKRHRIRGVFERRGLKSGYRGELPTMLLQDLEALVEGGWIEVADHLWMNLSKEFLKYGLFRKGDVIEFDGRVDSYERKPCWKGHDYRIVYPTKVVAFKEGSLLMVSDKIYDKDELIGIIRRRVVV